MNDRTGNGATPQPSNGMDGEMLWITRANIETVVARVAPDMVMLPRECFEGIARQMLGLVEDALAADQRAGVQA